MIRARLASSGTGARPAHSESINIDEDTEAHATSPQPGLLDLSQRDPPISSGTGESPPEGPRKGKVRVRERQNEGVTTFKLCRA